MVFLDGYKLVKEVYTQQGDNLSDRPSLPLFYDIIGDRGQFNIRMLNLWFNISS